MFVCVRPCKAFDTYHMVNLKATYMYRVSFGGGGGGAPNTPPPLKSVAPLEILGANMKL